MLVQLPKLQDNSKCKPFSAYNFRQSRARSPQSTYFSKPEKVRFEQLSIENRPQESNDRPQTSLNIHKISRDGSKSVQKQRKSQILSESKTSKDRESLGFLDKLSTYRHSDTLQEPSLSWLLCDYNKNRPQSRINRSSKEVFRLRKEKIILPSSFSKSNRETPIKQRKIKKNNTILPQKFNYEEEDYCYSLNIRKCVSDVKGGNLPIPKSTTHKAHERSSSIEIQTDITEKVVFIPDCISESNSQEEESPIHRYRPKYV